MIVRMTVAQLERNPTETDSVGARSASNRLYIWASRHETALSIRSKPDSPSGSMSRCIDHGRTHVIRMVKIAHSPPLFCFWGNDGGAPMDSLEVLNCEQSQCVASVASTNFRGTGESALARPQSCKFRDLKSGSEFGPLRTRAMNNVDSLIAVTSTPNLLARSARAFSSMRRGVPLGIIERHTPAGLLRMLRRQQPEMP